MCELGECWLIDMHKRENVARESEIIFFLPGMTLLSGEITLANKICESALAICKITRAQKKKKKLTGVSLFFNLSFSFHSLFCLFVSFTPCFFLLAKQKKRAKT